MTEARLRLHARLAGVRLHAAASPPAATGDGPALLDPIRARAHSEEALRQDATRLVQQVHGTIEEVTSRVEDHLRATTDWVVELGLGLAARVLQGEIEDGRYNPAPAVLEAMRHALQGPSEGAIVVYLHPADLAIVLSTLDDDGVPEIERPELRFEVDHSLARGQCRVETGIGQILHDPEQVLELAMNEIRKESRR